MKTKNVRTTLAALLSAALLSAPAAVWGQATQHGVRVVSKADVTKVNTTEITADRQAVGVDDNSTVNVTVADKTADGKVAKVTVTKVTDLAASTVTVSGANTIDYNASTTLMLTVGPAFADGAVSWRYEAQSDNSSNGKVEFSSQTAVSASNGQATVSVKGTGAGKVNVYAKVGNVESAAYTITINKIADAATLSASSVDFGSSTGNKTVNVSGNIGTVSASVTSGSGCEVGVSENTITITRKSDTAFSATITVTIAESTNYNSTMKTINVSGTACDPGIAASSVSSSHIGYVLAANGKIYETVATATSASTTAVAMIAYVGTASNCSHGLAIALEDVSSNKLTWDSSGSDNGGKTASVLVTNWGNSHSVSGGTWRLPSVDDWKYMFQGCGGATYSSSTLSASTYSYGNFRDKLKALNNDYDVQSDFYWSSTEYSGGASYAWAYAFDDKAFYHQTEKNKAHGYVRAVFAF